MKIRLANKSWRDIPDEDIVADMQLVCVFRSPVDVGKYSVTHKPSGLAFCIIDSKTKAKQAARRIDPIALTIPAYHKRNVKAIIKATPREITDIVRDATGLARKLDAIAELCRTSPAAAAMVRDDNTGICRACGAEQSGVEPDARKYRCEACGAHEVYGAEELLIMGEE